MSQLRMRHLPSSAALTTLIVIFSITCHSLNATTAKWAVSRLVISDSQRKQRNKEHDVIPSDLFRLISQYLPPREWDLTDSKQLHSCLQAIRQNKIRRFRLIVETNCIFLAAEDRHFLLEGTLGNFTMNTHPISRLIAGHCKVFPVVNAHSSTPIRSLGADEEFKFRLTNSDVERRFDLSVTNKMTSINIWCMIRILDLGCGPWFRQYNPYGWTQHISIDSVQLQALDPPDSMC